MKKTSVRFLVCILLLAVILSGFTVSVSAADMTASEIRNQISVTYQKSRNSRGSSFSGYCGAYVGYQLFHLGINNSYIGKNGNETFNYYKNMSYSSGGYKITAYPSSGYTLKNALKQISQNGTKNVYNILIGLKKGNTQSSQTYGHTAFIHAIIDGTVYFSESSNLVLPGIGTFPEGTPISCSIDYFCDAIYMWNSGYAPVFDGLIHFQKESEQSSVLTISGVNYPIQKKSGAQFEIFGVISSSYVLENAEAVVYDSNGKQVLGIGSYTHHGRKVFNLNDFASDMKFEKLSVGEYTYKIYAHDIRGYTAIVEKVFSVGSSSTTSGTISKIEGTHVCDSMTGTPYTWDSGIIKKIPSCTETGLKEYTCMECKKTKNTVIPATGHDFDTEFTVDYEATDYSAGQKSRHCKNCSEITDITEIPIIQEGDVNRDGAVDARDLVRLMRFIAGEQVEIVSPDVNEDGDVNVKDLIRIMKYIALE